MSSLPAEEALHFSCPSCGGNLEYSIEKGKLVCKSCDRQYDLKDIPDPSSLNGGNVMDVQEYHCPQCGAEIHTAQGEPVAFCSFCGANAVFTHQISRLERPNQIVPFKITRAQCESIYRKRVKKALFAPRELLSQETLSHFQPIYIPFWQYKATYNGPGSYQYKEKYFQDNADYTDTYHEKLNVHIKMDKVYYDASSRFDDETALRLCMKPGEARPFHAGYLCGCFAEGADVGKNVYKSVITSEAQRRLTQRLGKPAAIRGSLRYSIKMVLLPVWLLASRQGERVLYTAINGETGEIVCDTTVNPARYLLFSGLLTLLIFAALMLLGSKIILRARLTAGLCGMLSALGCAALFPHIRDTVRRAKHDADPTRWELSRHLGNNITLPPDSWYTEPRWKKLLPWIPYVFVTLLFTLFRGLQAHNMNEFVGAFSSDRSVYPVLLAFISAVIMWWFSFRALKLRRGLGFFALALLQSFTFVYLRRTPQREPLYYLSIGMLVLLALLVILQFVAHNGYVTRPVPIFGKNKKEKRA